MIRLEKFRLENALRVWKSASLHRPPPEEPGNDPLPAPPAGPVTPEGGDGDTQNGGDGGGCGDDPIQVDPPQPEEEDGGDEETGAQQSDAGGDLDRPGTDSPRWRRPRGGTPIEVPGEDDAPGLHARVLVVDPHGLEGETGSLAGRIRVHLAAPAPRELCFRVVPGAAGVLDLATGDEIVVPAGTRHGGIALHALVAGATAVSLCLLDEAGVASDAMAPACVEVRTASVASHATTRIGAALRGCAWAPGSGCARVALAGSDVGPLRIGRTGFARIDDEVTWVGIAVEDPAGVLSPLPAEVGVPAGDAFTELPLQLTAAVGEARITLRHDDDVLVVCVRSVAQAWSARPLVRVPVGATAPVTFRLAYRSPEPRDVSSTCVSACIDGGGATTTVLPGETLGRIAVRGIEPGSAVLRLFSPALPDVEVQVEVVPATVVVADGRLELSALDPSAGGRIHLCAPEGFLIASLDVPAEAHGFLEVDGLGSGEVVLEFTPSPDVPARLSLPVTFSLPADRPVAPFRLAVLDARTPRPDPHGIRSYRIEVR